MPSEHQHPETDQLMMLSERMTGEELNDYISKKFADDFGSFKRLINEEKERMKKANCTPRLQALVPEIIKLYESLIQDGYLKKDIDMFDRQVIEYTKSAQARKEATNLFDEFVDKPIGHKKTFEKANRAYVVLYEDFIKCYISPITVKIKEKQINQKAVALQAIKEYKNGSFSSIFDSLSPQIRNSIQHSDYIIHPTKPEITFDDRNKPSITLTLDEYWNKIWELFEVNIGFDMATFEITLPFCEYILEQLDFLQKYAQKHELKWQKNPNAPLTLLDYATLLKSKGIEP